MPAAAHASVQITEIMYDLEGADSGFEWIEITNTGPAAVDIGSWRLFEGNTNHKLVLKKGSSTLLPPGASAIIADKPENFLSHWPNVAMVFDSAFSLSNTGEALALKNGSNVIEQVAYISDMGAKGDGGSLHRYQDSFVAAMPNPGVFPGERKPVVSKSPQLAEQLSTTQPEHNSGASRAHLAAPAHANAPAGMPLWPWVVGLFGIIGLGITAVLFVRREQSKPEMPDEADGFEIVDADGKVL